ncbi:MAG: hypothetical protein ACERKO_11860, partial [Acetanaerobacterium sp.]
SALVEGVGTRLQTIGSSTLSYAMVPVPKAYVGKKVGSIESDPEELLFGVLHQNLSLTLASHTEYELCVTDMLVYARRID